jgi:hypothetical protein
LVWAQSDGIWRADVGGALISGCTGVTPTRIIPGAGAPDWGPANVASGIGTGGGEPGQGGGLPGPLKVTLNAPKSLPLATLRTKGLRVTTSFSAQCRAAIALVVTKTEARRLKIGPTETVIGRIGPVAVDAGRFSATVRLLPKYARALKGATRISAVVISTGVVDTAKPTVKARRITFTG